EFRARGKGFLRADTHGGESRIKTGSRKGLFFGQASAKKNREVADEGVACAGGVDGPDRKGLDQLRALWSCQQSTASAESDDDTAKILADEGVGALPGVFDGVHGEPGDDFGLRFIGNEIVGGRQLLQIDLLSGSRIDDAADAVSARELHSVVDRVDGDFEL